MHFTSKIFLWYVYTVKTQYRRFYFFSQTNIMIEFALIFLLADATNNLSIELKFI